MSRHYLLVTLQTETRKLQRYYLLEKNNATYYVLQHFLQESSLFVTLLNRLRKCPIILAIISLCFFSFDVLSQSKSDSSKEITLLEEMSCKQEREGKIQIDISAFSKTIFGGNSTSLGYSPCINNCQNQNFSIISNNIKKGNVEISGNHLRIEIFSKRDFSKLLNLSLANKWSKSESSMLADAWIDINPNPADSRAKSAMVIELEFKQEPIIDMEFVSPSKIVISYFDSDEGYSAFDKLFPLKPPTSIGKEGLALINRYLPKKEGENANIYTSALKEVLAPEKTYVAPTNAYYDFSENRENQIEPVLPVKLFNIRINIHGKLYYFKASLQSRLPAN